MNWKNILGLTVAAVAVCSCGMPIEMTKYVPAKVNMKRGATIGIRYNGKLSDMVTDQLILKMDEDGYYNLEKSYTSSDYYIAVGDLDEFRVQFGLGLGTNGRIFYDDWYSSYNLDETERSKTIARKIYHHVAPHEEKYRIRVSVDKDENPKLYEAVLAAQSQKWNEARKLAREAVAQCPNDPENYYLLSMADRNDSNYDGAIKWLQKALELAPGKGKYETEIKNNQALQSNENKVIEQLSN